jgi:hypothetical protein
MTIAMSRRSMWFALLHSQEDRERIPAAGPACEARGAFLVPPDPAAWSRAQGDAVGIDPRTLRPRFEQRGTYFEVTE